MKYDIDIIVAEGPLEGTGLGTVLKLDTSVKHWDDDLHKAGGHGVEVNLLSDNAEKAIREFEKENDDTPDDVDELLVSVTNEVGDCDWATLRELLTRLTAKED